MMNYKYILLDADDTLLDFAAAERAAFFNTLARFSPESDYEPCALYSLYHRVNDELWKALERGETTREKLKIERFSRVFRESGVLSETNVPAFAAEYMISLSHEGMLVPCALETCKKLAQKYRLYIVTNGTSSVQHGRLDNSPLAPYLSGLFISEDIGKNKPSPEFFDFVLRSVGDSDRSHYVVVGDSVTSDIGGAEASGLDSVLVTRGREYPPCSATYTVKSISDILNIFLAEECCDA